MVIDKKHIDKIKLGETKWKNELNRTLKTF